MSLYNEDELVPPKWLDQYFFEKVLSKYENDKHVRIVEMDISPASMKGDHYVTIMFRIKLEYKIDDKEAIAKKCLIVKTIPEEGYKLEIAKNSQVFETEIDMYTKTLPKIEEILAENGDVTRLAPKIIYYELQPTKVIVLEDLCDMGYDTLRTRFLNLLEVKAVYGKLAKIHAVSYMLGRSEQHELVTKYQTGIFSDSRALKNELIANGIHNFIAMLSAHDEFDEYLPKFKAIEKDLFADCKRLYRAYQLGAKDEIFVLNHGDFHLKNLMFKFSKKTHLEDFLMVDFQMCVYGPSTVDMLYSTYMLLSPELRLEHQSELMHDYFAQFLNTLKLLKYAGELPKFAHFQIANLRYRNFAVFLLTTLLPLFYEKLAKNPEDMKNEGSADFITQNDKFVLLYRNEVFLAEVRKALPKLLQAGFLD